MKKFLLLTTLSLIIFSCASKNTNTTNNSEYLKGKKYLEKYVSNNDKAKVISKEKINKYDRTSNRKSTETLVKVDADRIERYLKKNLDKRKVETQMVSSPPVPIIVPAKVVRILIYPYIDAKGNFHGPNYLYTEVEKSRWVVGEFNSSSGSIPGRSFTILEK